jgi:cell division protein FtsL
MATAYQWSGAGNEAYGKAGQARISEAAKPQLVPRTARQIAGAGNGRKKLAMAEFFTVKRIDNSRLVRHVEPVKMRNLYRTVALGGIIAAFCMLYIYQHFRCIDLSFQLEDLKGKQELAQAANSKLKLEIATLRDPHRIDVIARHQLGLTQPTANQVREYAMIDGAEVAAVQYVRPNRAP